MINFGYRTFTALGQRLSVRALVVNTCLMGAALMFLSVTIGLGEYPLSATEVVHALLRRGDEFNQLVVVEWRLPIVCAALLFGALLGIGGAIFQSLTHNALGSPDIIGFDAGAYTAVLLGILIFGIRDYWSLAALSILGGLLVALAVYLLAISNDLQGFRMIIVGIALGALLGATNTYLITRADTNQAISVGFWAAGSLHRITWGNLIPVLCLALVIFIGCALLAPSLQQMELGDDSAIAHGVNLKRERALLMILGVSTTAVVTAAAGPISFIALVAPQLARRLTRSPGVSLMSSACMGALLLGISHMVSVLLRPTTAPIPAGIITVCMGGLYFIFLLYKETRREL